MRATYRSYAKINLHLEVLGARLDGYHELSTVFQTVDLCDLLTLEVGDRVEVVVLEIDTKRDRIALSLKQVGGDPYEDAIAGLGVGATVEGKVARLREVGATVVESFASIPVITMDVLAKHNIAARGA